MPGETPPPGVPGAPQRLGTNLARCKEAIAAAAGRVGRDPAEVSLLAVTKYARVEHVRGLYALGVRDFGESTVQGTERRIEERPLDGARWHLIGHLQRNKAAKALQLFGAIHSVDSERLAKELASQASRRSLEAPDLYIELNLSDEPQKTGLPESRAREVLTALSAEQLLAPRLRGLMTMAPHSDDPESSRPYFRRLRQARDELAREGILPPGAGLSMGMSGDFQVAIEEGATVVRVGTLLFDGLD